MDYRPRTWKVQEHSAKTTRSIDTSKASALLGVRDILTYEDPDIATGKRVMDYPTTPDRVLKAIGKI